MRMLEVEILGVKLSADLLNPDVAERYECGYKHAIERMKNAGSLETGAEGIREQCQAVIDYIDSMFGEGSSKQILGEETDLLTCLDALDDMTHLYENYVTPQIKDKMQTLTGDAKKG